MVGRKAVRRGCQDLAFLRMEGMVEVGVDVDVDVVVKAVMAVVVVEGVGGRR